MPVSELYTVLQVVYMFMMYISAFPIVIAMRHSNVSEDRAGALTMHTKLDTITSSGSEAGSEDAELGRLLPGAHPAEPSKTPVQRAFRLLASLLTTTTRPSSRRGPNSRPSLLGQKIRRQLLHDLWVLPCVIVLISLLEMYGGHASDSDPMDHEEYHRPPVNILHVAFEVVSAYGCVGLSVGLARASVSLAGGWNTLSRLVLVGVMLKGRHRGLSVILDRVSGVGGEAKWEGEEDDDDDEAVA